MALMNVNFSGKHFLCNNPSKLDIDNVDAVCLVQLTVSVLHPTATCVQQPMPTDKSPCNNTPLATTSRPPMMLVCTAFQTLNKAHNHD